MEGCWVGGSGITGLVKGFLDGTRDAGGLAQDLEFEAVVGDEGYVGGGGFGRDGHGGCA